VVTTIGVRLEMGMVNDETQVEGTRGNVVGRQNYSMIRVRSSIPVVLLVNLSEDSDDTVPGSG